MLGPATELVYETSAPFLWAMVAGARRLAVRRHRQRGQGLPHRRAGQGIAVLRRAELEVHALAPAPDGGLYVGTSPDGRIYKVDRNGAVATFFDGDDKYIWALAVDGKGNVYAGTGEKGVVYKIAPDGKGATFYQTKATHATALAFDKTGNLLVGTESPGRVLRVDPEGKAFVLLDSPFQEIRALRFDDKGMLYVAAVSGRPSAGGAPIAADDARSADARSESRAGAVGLRRDHVDRRRRRRQRIGIERHAAGGSPGAEGRRLPHRAGRPLGSAVGIARRLAVRPDLRSARRADRRHRQQGQDLSARRRSAAADAARARRRAAGHGAPQGRRRPALLRDRESRQAVPALAGAGAARHLRVRAARRADGVDLGRDQLARDDVRRANGNRIEVFTRSGNTETPDDTWSAWSAAYTNADGSPITSPKARYLQWRAVLTGKGDGPVLTSVTAAYLQRNLRPQVRTITVHPPGIVFQKPFSTGDPELAGFDDQTTPERKLAAAASAQPGSSSGARPPHVSEGAADARLAGRRRERRRPGLRRAVPARRRDGVEDAAQGDAARRSSSGTRRRFRTAPTS